MAIKNIISQQILLNDFDKCQRIIITDNTVPQKSLVCKNNKFLYLLGDCNSNNNNEKKTM